MKLDQISNSIITRIPSLQDVSSAISVFKIGKSSKIWPEEGGEVVLKPMRGQEPRVDGKKYAELAQEAIDLNDIDVVINGLKNMGIEMTYSDVAKSKVPSSSGSEVAVVSGQRGEGGKRATELKRTGTHDHVEIEVPYTEDDLIEPSEALKDIDDYYIGHTHPKLTDNNYTSNIQLR